MVPQFSEIPKSKDAISGSFVLNAFFRLACWVSRIHIDQDFGLRPSALECWGSGLLGLRVESKAWGLEPRSSRFMALGVAFQG